MFGPETEFGSLLQQAVKIKGCQMQEKRKQFAKRPDFFQHTLFFGEREECRIQRELTFGQRLEIANKFKQEGNEAYKKGCYMEAVDRYEQAAGLFIWIVSADPDWKSNKRGIDDDVLQVVDRSGETTEEKLQAQRFRENCVLNIAACHLKREEWDLVRECCKYVLEDDTIIAGRADSDLKDGIIKALYRRAQTYLLASNSGVQELERAYQDLQRTVELDPGSAACRSLFARAKEEKKRAEKKAKTAYSGMFSKPSSERTPEEESELNKYRDRVGKIRDDDSWDQKLKDAEMLRDLYEKNGKMDEAAALDRQLKTAKQALSKGEDVEEALLAGGKDGGRKPIDYTNPTAQMIEDAKKHGLDLTDPRIQRELNILEKKKAAGEDVSEEKLQEGLEEEKNKRANKIWWTWFCFFVIIGTLYRLWSSGIMSRFLLDSGYIGLAKWLDSGVLDAGAGLSESDMYGGIRSVPGSYWLEGEL